MKTINHFFSIVVIFFVLFMPAHKLYASLSLGVLYGTAASGGTGLLASLLTRFVGNIDCVNQSRVKKCFSSQEGNQKKSTLRIIADATSDMLGCAAFSFGQQASEELLGDVMDENSAKAVTWVCGAASGLAIRFVTNSFIHGALNVCGVVKQRSDNIQLIGDREKEDYCPEAPEA